MYHFRPVLLVALTFSLIICSIGLPVASAQAGNPTNCVKYDASTDYFPYKVQVQYAAGFEIEYHGNYRVVRVTRPWQDAKQTFEYMLVQCGTPAPTDEKYKDAMVINIPVKSVIAMSTTYIAHLTELGVLDRLVGMDSLQYVSSAAVIAMGKAGKLVEIGSGAQLNIELVAKTNPDLIMTYGIGYPQYDSQSKLTEAG